MVKKMFITTLIVTTSLFANSIQMNLVDQNPDRKNIVNSAEILSFNESVKDAIHSVVNISTKKRIKTASSGIEQMFNDPFFRQFFGRNFGDTLPKERLQQSLGSGVILSKDGYIVTNAHVVEGADEIVVTVGDDEKEYEAKMIGSDKDSDLAVIKIEAKGLQPIAVGSSKNLAIGDVVFAIGNPFGVGQTVTQGIVSALNKNKVGINRYENFIQTDASINPGNSGGALIDSRGALIGINSAILTRSGGNNGVGFAIPVAMVKQIVKTLVADGKVSRGYLGVSIEDLSKETKDVYRHDYGALVLDVGKDSPADKKGLQRGDLIYKINGQKVKDASDLQTKIGSFKPGEVLSLSIERNKKDISVDIKLDSRESVQKITENETVLQGLFVSEIDAQNSKKYRIPASVSGVLITDVEAGSKAEKVGFQAGDIIIQVENIEIETLKDLQRAMSEFKKVPKRVYVNRYGRVMMSVIR